MIIDKSNTPVFATSSVAVLWVVGRGEAEGVLPVGEWDYEVFVTREDERRMWVRVRVAEGISNRRQRDRAVLAAAHMGRLNSRWRPLSIDPRDGEVVYSETLSCDQSSEALDRFLEAARSFLIDCGHDVSEVICGRMPCGPARGPITEEELDVLYGRAPSLPVGDGSQDGDVALGDPLDGEDGVSRGGA